MRKRRRLSEKEMKAGVWGLYRSYSPGGWVVQRCAYREYRTSAGACEVGLYSLTTARPETKGRTRSEAILKFSIAHPGESLYDINDSGLYPNVKELANSVTEVDP